MIDAFNAVADRTGVTASAWGDGIELRAQDGRNISIGTDGSAVHAALRMPIASGSTVAVIGAGTLGLLTIALLAPVTWWGWNNARTLDIMQSISLGLPLSIFAYSIPVTAGLMIVFSLGLLARRFSASPIRSGGGAVEI